MNAAKEKPQQAVGSWFAHLQLVGVVLLWGATWPAGRVVASNIPPITGAAWRFVLASVCMLLWMQLRGGAKKGFPRYSNRQWMWIALGGLSGVTCYALLFMYGLSMVQPGRGSLFITLTPVLITLLAAWLFKEPLNWKMFASMLLAVVGACIVITKGDLLGALQQGLQLGEYLLLGCVITWALYSLLGKITAHLGDNFAVTSYSIVVGTVALLIVAWFIDGVQPALPMQQGLKVVRHAQWVWVALVFLGIGGTVLAYAWFFNAITVVGAATSASYVSLVPVFGVFFSWLFLSEPVDFSLIVGGALAVCGVLCMSFAKQRLLSAQKSTTKQGKTFKSGG